MQKPQRPANAASLTCAKPYYSLVTWTLIHRQLLSLNRPQWYLTRSPTQLCSLRVKTLLACLICYVFYSGTDWEGIHTCMLTCIIVANPSIGSSYQKMALRFGGAFLAQFWPC